MEEQTKLSCKEANILADKLKRHYKVRFTLHFDGKRKGGVYKGSWRTITVRYNPTIWLLCHEVSHAIDHQRYNWHGMKQKHTKRFDRIDKRVLQYCKKKNYWQTEIARRTTIPAPQPEPTKEQQKLIKIEHKKVLLQSYEKKLRYWTKLYTNKIRRCKKSIAMLEHHSTSSVSAKYLVSEVYSSSIIFVVIFIYQPSLS